MSKLKLRRPSPALVVSLIALFVALGSGAYAASKIPTSALQNKAVTTKKLDNKAVSSSKIKKKAVKQKKIAGQAVTDGKIADVSITNSKLLSPTIWAYINGSGTPTVSRTNLDSKTGAGATGVERKGVGHYEVTWEPQDPGLDGIDGCLPLVAASSLSEDRIAQTNLKTPGPTFQTVVRTRDSSDGSDKDANFNTALFC